MEQHQEIDPQVTADILESACYSAAFALTNLLCIPAKEQETVLNAIAGELAQTSTTEMKLPLNQRFTGDTLEKILTWYLSSPCGQKHSKETPLLAKLGVVKNLALLQAILATAKQRGIAVLLPHSPDHAADQAADATKTEPPPIRWMVVKKYTEPAVVLHDCGWRQDCRLTATQLYNAGCSLSKAHDTEFHVIIIGRKKTNQVN